MNTPNNYLDRASRDDDVEYQEEWLSAYLDDELTAAQRALVEQRIVEDEQAAVMLQDLMRVRSLVGKLPAWNGNSLSLADVTQKLSRPPAKERFAFADEAASEFVNDEPIDSIDDRQTRRVNFPVNAGDYHNDLNSGLQLQLSSASTAGVVDRDIVPDFSRGRRSSSIAGFASWASAWLRPAILVASLLLALGLGFMLWPSGSSLSVATSSGARDVSSSSVDNASGAIASASDSELAMNADAFAVSGAPAASYAAPTALPELAAADAVPQQSLPLSGDRLSESRGQAGGASLGNPATKMEFSRNAALPSSVAPLKPSGSLPSSKLRKELTESDEESMHQPGMRKQAKATPGSNLADTIPANKSALPRLPNVDAKATPAPLQLARSSAWTDAEIDAGLIRLSPFLNLPLIPKTERPSSDLRLTQGSAGTAPSAAIEYPIAVVARQRSEREGSRLPALLQQASFGLIGISDRGPASKIPGQVPYGADTTTAPSTVALFVDRGLAQQILQTAEQAGEVVGKPVWIMSTNNNEAVANSAQKVVLLFSPQ